MLESIPVSGLGIHPRGAQAPAPLKLPKAPLEGASLNTALKGRATARAPKLPKGIQVLILLPVGHAKP